jgi:hypothetical protein
MLKDHVDLLSPFLTRLVNASLSSGVVPDSMKHALVAPLLKKHNLDPECLKNFRPVSNLSFVSKLLERAVARRLLNHVSTNNLHERFQSAYRPQHSTETALVMVQNNILEALDNHQGVILVLLDLSAAFDTVDHALLLSRLKHRTGIQGTALKWITSYLSGRCQAVTLSGNTSEDHSLPFGVPQGSVLGPLLFTLYTGPIGDIIRRHGLKFHLFADDTQLYIRFSISDLEDRASAIRRIQDCLAELRAWMSSNLLKLNDDKTVAIVAASHHHQSKHNITVIKIGDCDITPSPYARNIGVIFDSEMSMVEQVRQVCRTAYWHLHNIGSVRSCLSEDAAARLVLSLVVSRLDYGNALLCGLPDTLISKLQRVQNSAARLVVRCSRRDHITPVLKRLHWLPIRQRIMYKVLVLTFRGLHGLAPEYVSDMLHRYTPARRLRSASNHDLCVPKTSSRYGDRMFSVSGPREWNSLPLELKGVDCLTTFKRLLKTHLFRQAYGP